MIKIPDHRILVPSVPDPGQHLAPPSVSIITTVYDRLDCLERCLRSVYALHFEDYEHIVVADCPPSNTLARLRTLIESLATKTNKSTFASLCHRRNDWGITPASLGLNLARGRYISFLSDDNGYLPGHFNKLWQHLESDSETGFAYSSCLYDNRRVLASARPRRKHIDLGQPLFRRKLFDDYLGGILEFREQYWDWLMIREFVDNGVRFRHFRDATFVFRLAKYPQFLGQS